MSKVPEELREKALELVREEYENVAHMSRLTLEEINRVHDPSRRYRSMDDFLREYWSRAGAVSSFAAKLGLIDSEDALQVLVEFQKAHPDLNARHSSGHDSG
jgi:uncharacterized protein YlaN (UPF0358 family)